MNSIDLLRRSYLELGLVEEHGDHEEIQRFSSLARKVSQMVTVDVQRAQVVLELIEIGLEKGTEPLRVAICTGFLERLLAEASAGRLPFGVLAPWLGARSLEYCREWDRFTGLQTQGLW